MAEHMLSEITVAVPEAVESPAATLRPRPLVMDLVACPFIDVTAFPVFPLLRS
jgi:hypothetical protein